MPGEFLSQVSAPPMIVPQPDTAAQSTIDELRREVAELRIQLADTQREPPPPVFAEDVSSSVLSLPIVNKQGVNIDRDESQRVRFAVVDTALFMPDTWQLTAEGEDTLRTIAAEIRAFDSEAVLDIEGHTDSLMHDPNNPTQKHEVASVKTKVVMDFFVSALRWDTTQIGMSSFGRNRPIADNGTPEGRERNNRIEIVVR
jgi:chemotaxis protein MotB